MVLLIASAIGKMIGNLAGKKAAESVLESKPRPSIPKPKELKPYNVVGIHLLAPQEFKPFDLDLPDNIKNSSFIKRTESYDSDSSGYFLTVGMTEYTIKSAPPVEEDILFSLEQMTSIIKLTKQTKSVRSINISGQLGKLAKIQGDVDGKPRFIHGVYFSKGNKLWQVLINGQETSQNTALAKKIIDSISINP